MEERVKDLLGCMTVEEKFWQLYMIPFPFDSVNEDQYKNGSFGFQVSASSKSSDETQQILNYDTRESGLVLARKINRIQKYFVEKIRKFHPRFYLCGNHHLLL